MLGPGQGHLLRPFFLPVLGGRRIGKSSVPAGPGALEQRHTPAACVRLRLTLTRGAPWARLPTAAALGERSSPRVSSCGGGGRRRPPGANPAAADPHSTIRSPVYGRRSGGSDGRQARPSRGAVTASRLLTRSTAPTPPTDRVIVEVAGAAGGRRRPGAGRSGAVVAFDDPVADRCQTVGVREVRQRDRQPCAVTASSFRAACRGQPRPFFGAARGDVRSRPSANSSGPLPHRFDGTAATASDPGSDSASDPRRRHRAAVLRRPQRPCFRGGDPLPARPTASGGHSGASTVARRRLAQFLRVDSPTPSDPDLDADPTSSFSGAPPAPPRPSSGPNP